MAKNAVFQDRNKHIDTLYHYIRGCIADKKVQLKYVKSQDHITDMFMKSLKREDFLTLAFFTTLKGLHRSIDLFYNLALKRKEKKEEQQK